MGDDYKLAKQTYLCQKIIDAGYDAQDFAQYCQKICGNVDIDSWTMKDLQDITKGYISSKKTSQGAIHQTSFIDYQQDQQKPTFQISNDPPINISSKQTVEQNKSYKLHDNEKDNLDKLFKDDPFSNFDFKKKPKQTKNNDWGYSSANVKSSYPSYPDELWRDKSNMRKDDFSAQWDFDDYTPKVQKKRSVTTATKPNMNFFSNTESVNNYQQPVNNYKQPVNNYQQSNLTSSQITFDQIKKQQKSNPTIFDINFDDIKDVNVPSKKGTKTQSHGINKKHSLDSQLQGSSQIPNDLDLYQSNTNVQPTQNQVHKKVKPQGQRVVQQDWSDKVNVIKAKTRPLANKHNLQVVVSGHEVVKKNLFMPNQVKYQIKTQAINAVVKRKYNQFLKLRNNLQKFYPGFRLPFLTKTGWIQETDPANIATQKALIGNFINDLLMNRQLKNCRIVQEFLTISDNKTLKSKFQQYDKMARLHSIQELCLLPGQVQVGYSDAHRIYLQKLPAFVHNSQIILDKYKKQLDQYVYTQQLLQKNIQDLFETTSQLQALVKGFNSEVQIGQCYELQSTFRLIKKIYKQMGKQNTFEIKIFENEIKPLIKYQRDNFGTIKEVIEYKARFNESFNPNIKNDKKQIYSTANLEQYKTRIDQPSRSLTVLKYQHGYFANQVVVQAKRMMLNFSKKLSHKFSQYCYGAEQKGYQAVNMWKQMKKSMGVPVMA